MEPPKGKRGPPSATRSSRILGLIAAVGFSVAMWVFIAVAVLGLVLKVFGPREVTQGLAAGFSTVFPAPAAGNDTGEEDLPKALGRAPFLVLGQDAKPTDQAHPPAPPPAPSPAASKAAPAK